MNDKIYPSMVIRSQAEAIELLEKENAELKEENEKLKNNNNPLRGIFAGVNDDMLLRDCGNLSAENQQLKHILDELEKWLEEEITTIKTTFSQVNGNYFIMNDRIEVLEDTLDKLKELRGRENE